MFSGRWMYVAHIQAEQGWGRDYASTLPWVTDLDDLRLKTSKECNNLNQMNDLGELRARWRNINVKNAVAFIKEVEDAAFDAWRKSSLNITNTSDVMENDVSRVRHYRERGVRQYFQ